MHSSLIGMGPSSDYTPFTPGDDDTRGGWARLAALIAMRRTLRSTAFSMSVLPWEWRFRPLASRLGGPAT